MATNGTYPEDPRAKVNRKNQRGAYDYATIHHTLTTAPILNVAFAPSHADPFPTILPMIGVVASWDAHKENPSAAPDLNHSAQDVYVHGYVTARLMSLAKHSQTLTDEGLPVCISATCVDGLVLALTPFSHSMNYRSVVVHGYASPVTDADEKLWAMEKVTEHVLTGRWAGSRVPPTNAELTSTGILRVRIVSASAKVHVGGPNDDKKEQSNAEVKSRVWTGVVPSWFTLGEPVPGSYNEVKEVPAYVTRYIKEINERNERIAREAVEKTE